MPIINLHSVLGLYLSSFTCLLDLYFEKLYVGIVCVCVCVSELQQNFLGADARHFFLTAEYNTYVLIIVLSLGFGSSCGHGLIPLPVEGKHTSQLVYSPEFI